MREAAVWILIGTLMAPGLAIAQEPAPSAAPTPEAAPLEPAPSTPDAPVPTPLPTPVPTPVPTPTPPPRQLSPDELRSRERAVILALQTISLAERTYAAANGGFFGEMRCLTDPRKCLPNYPPDGAAPLDPTFDWLETRLDYARQFHPGPAPTPDQLRRANLGAGSVRTWAFTATPVFPGVTGSHGLCCDSKGHLCMTEDGSQAPVRDGLCEPCKKLQ